jgi:hypothetical protein
MNTMAAVLLGMGIQALLVSFLTAAEYIVPTSKQQFIAGLCFMFLAAFNARMQ